MSALGYPQWARRLGMPVGGCHLGGPLSYHGQCLFVEHVEALKKARPVPAKIQQLLLVLHSTCSPSVRDSARSQQKNQHFEEVLALVFTPFLGEHHYYDTQHQAI